jgi:hypothetical protein
VEEGAVGFAHILAVLDLPLGLLAILVGLSTVVRFIPHQGSAALLDLGLVERIAVGLCAGVAMLGVLGTLETVLVRRPDFPPLAILFAAAVISCGWPAVAWRSRWRAVAEGAATVCLALAAILSGFTIGFMFVPLVALMVWVCVLRFFLTFRRVSGETPRRVDSLT